MQQASETTGTLAAALAHGLSLLDREPAMAAEQARAILEVVPGSGDASLLLGRALLILEDAAGAVPPLRHATQLLPGSGRAWRALGDALHGTGDIAGGGAAHLKAVSAGVQDRALIEAGGALADGDLPVAERLLRARLKAEPTDVAAIRMLAELATRLGRYGDAERLLTRALELAPDFAPARHNLAVALYRQTRSEEALAHIDRLLGVDARNPAYRNLKAAILVRIGDYDQAIVLYEAVLAEFPQQPKVWMSLGHSLKTVARIPDSIAAYQKSIDQLPTLGESYWSLANLKTFRFTDDAIAAMRALLARDDLDPEDRFHIHFALGKALEDAGAHADSFAHYVEGNRLRRAVLDYDPDDLTDQRKRAEALFTPAFFAARSGQGDAAPDPIFVVGMPRSGSTLVEQILSSHPLIEGTMELPDLTSIARRLSGRKDRSEESRYPEILAELPADELAALGAEYIERTRIQRKTDRPYFIDKLPNNFAHAGLIHLILPNAKIIDVRRHPLGCCFSGFKQHFARGQGFSYDLCEIGRYYRDYVLMMAHIDATLPGRVHRVIYERLVGDLEGEVRSLLGYVGVDFDERCLAFHETRRAVRTPSSEQVRQPIFTDAVDHWRHYEPWLGPLKDSLGDVLAHYPDAPPR